MSMLLGKGDVRPTDGSGGNGHEPAEASASADHQLDEVVPCDIFDRQAPGGDQTSVAAGELNTGQSVAPPAEAGVEDARRVAVDEVAQGLVVRAVER